MRACRRGFVRPRVLPVLLGVAASATVATRFVDGAPIAPPPEVKVVVPAEVVELSSPPLRFRRAAPADLVGLYVGADGCGLRVDTVGRAHGCGLDRRIDRIDGLEGWRVDGRGDLAVYDRSGALVRRYTLRRTEETK